MSRYRMIAREDFELHAKDVVAQLVKERDRMYRALDVIGVKDFESRDALNGEIQTNMGEQRAWRKMCEWVAENYKTDGTPMSTEALMELQNRVEREKVSHVPGAGDFGGDDDPNRVECICDPKVEYGYEVRCRAHGHASRPTAASLIDGTAPPEVARGYADGLDVE